MKSFAIVVSLLAANSWADPSNDDLIEAADLLDGALLRVNHAAPNCKLGVLEPLDQAVLGLDLTRHGGGDRLEMVRALINSALPLTSNCGEEVGRHVFRAKGLLGGLRTSISERAIEDRRRDRARERGPLTAPASVEIPDAQIALSSISREGEPSVQMHFDPILVRGLGQQSISFAMRLRAQGGEWDEWTSSNAFEIPNDDFRTSFTFFFRHATLRAANRSQGRFVAQLTAFDGRGREVGSREIPFNLQAQAVVPPPPPLRVEVSLPRPSVVTDAVFEREHAVRVEVSQISIRNGAGQALMLSARFRSQRGQWSDAMTAQPIMVSSNNFVFKGPQAFFFRSDSLAAFDTSYGRFVGRVSLTDSAGNELAFEEFAFEVRTGQQWPAPGPVLPPPPPQAVVRDCGTPDDPGCSMQRRGRWSIDRPVFDGWVSSLRGAHSDFQREEMCRSVLMNNYLTAAQLGVVLELFNSDVSRMNVARVAATRLVNPNHALGLARGFRSSLSQAEFTKIISEQRD